MPGIFRIGQPAKKFDTLTPSKVAEVIRTFKFDERNFTKRFINPSNMSLRREKIYILETNYPSFCLLNEATAAAV